MGGDGDRDGETIIQSALLPAPVCCSRCGVERWIWELQVHAQVRSRPYIEMTLSFKLWIIRLTALDSSHNFYLRGIGPQHILRPQHILFTPIIELHWSICMTTEVCYRFTRFEGYSTPPVCWPLLSSSHVIQNETFHCLSRIPLSYLGVRGSNLQRNHNSGGKRSPFRKQFIRSQRGIGKLHGRRRIMVTYHSQSWRLLESWLLGRHRFLGMPQRKLAFAVTCRQKNANICASRMILIIRYPFQLGSYMISLTISSPPVVNLFQPLQLPTIFLDKVHRQEGVGHCPLPLSLARISKMRAGTLLLVGVIAFPSNLSWWWYSLVDTLYNLELLRHVDRGRKARIESRLKLLLSWRYRLWTQLREQKLRLYVIRYVSYEWFLQPKMSFYLPFFSHYGF